MSEPVNWKEFGKRLEAYGAGLANAPIDAVRYAGLGANEIFQMAGWRNQEEAIRAANAINQSMDNVPVIGPWMVKNHQVNPEMFKLGEIMAGAFGALGATKTINGTKQMGTLLPALGFTSWAAAKENIVEPYADERAKE